MDTATYYIWVSGRCNYTNEEHAGDGALSWRFAVI